MKASNFKYSISFFLNAQYIQVAVSPETTALGLIRNELGITGTKESCSEGDCGACTIAAGSLSAGKLNYRAINSCLWPAIRLHGKHIITIEGLSQGDHLNLIQEQMLEHHATQCGYCTPGIIMSLFCLFSGNQSPEKEDILQVLEGNLCRCTGYQPILSAAQSITDLLTKDKQTNANHILPGYVSDIEGKLASHSEPIKVIETNDCQSRELHGYYVPQTFEELHTCMDKFGDPERYRIISGGTDLMVDLNINRNFPENIIDISAIDDLAAIRMEPDSIFIGSGVTLTSIIEHTGIREKLPILRETLLLVGSEQIRNMATLAGNITNASPIADGVVALLGLDAGVVLFSMNGRRNVPLNDFFSDYKRTDLQSEEILGEIRIPIRAGYFNFEKSSKRQSVDIATVNSCCYLKNDNGLISDCRFAFGGMDKIPRLAESCPSVILGKKLDNGLILKCAEAAVREFEPISDVRGSADYRRQLVKNHIIKHLTKFLKLSE